MRGITHAALGFCVGAGLAKTAELAGVGSLVGSTPAWVLALGGALGALLPDIDEPEATLAHLPGKIRRPLQEQIRGVLRALLGRRLRGLADVLAGMLGLLVALVTGVLEGLTVALSTLIKAIFGHRGATHSLLLSAGVAAVAVGLAQLAGGKPWVGLGAAFGLGYLSHILPADALTPGGVPLFWPLSTRRVRLLPRPLCVRTGSAGDWLLMVLSGLAGLALLLF